MICQYIKGGLSYLAFTETSMFNGHPQATARMLSVTFWICQVPVIITGLIILRKVWKLFKLKKNSLVIMTDSRQLIHKEKGKKIIANYYNLNSVAQSTKGLKKRLGLIDVSIKGKLQDCDVPFEITVINVKNDQKLLNNLSSELTKSLWQAIEADQKIEAARKLQSKQAQIYYYLPNGTPVTPPDLAKTYQSSKSQDSKAEPKKNKPKTSSFISSMLKFKADKSKTKPTSDKVNQRKKSDQQVIIEPKPKLKDIIGQPLKNRKPENPVDYMGIGKA